MEKQLQKKLIMDKTTILCYDAPGGMKDMSGALLQFTGLPKIGFAHHFYMENYQQIHKSPEQSFELVYVKNGCILAELYGQTYEIRPGSLFVLFRHLPYHLYSADGGPQTHCSVQLIMDYTCEFLREGQGLPEDFGGLTLPLVLPPGPEAESLKKDLYALVADLGISREKYGFAASLAACGILAKLDSLYRQKLHSSKNTSSYWEYKIKRYITEHIHQHISLDYLSCALGKTPNYLNSVFREAAGISIHQYMNREKMQLVAELMKNKNMSFQMACENVAITDISHGYRLFKKHMGVTPGAYLAGEHWEIKIPSDVLK